MITNHEKFKNRTPIKIYHLTFEHVEKMMRTVAGVFGHGDVSAPLGTSELTLFRVEGAP